MEKSLREVCSSFGVSRRAVQGYEKHGLVCASGRNANGYLLYDETAQKRIGQIHLYQWFGFTLKEICSLMDASEEQRLKALKVRKEALFTEQKDLLKKLQMIEALITGLEET